MTSSGGGRIAFLDTFRFLAVTFALLAHVFTHHGLDDYATGPGLLRATLTRAATPSLLVVFGVMLEIVYARRFAGAPAAVAARMARRAGLCYLAFLATALVALAVGEMGPDGVLGAAVLLTTVPYSAILKLYLFLLLLGIGVVAARARWGVGVPLALAGAAWLADALWIDGSAPLPRPFRHLAGLLLGWGENHGPSVLHGVTLVALGMALGAALFSRPRSRAAGAAAALLLAAAAAVLARTLWAEGPGRLLAGIADVAAFRSDNHPAYYAYGAWATLGLVGLARALHAAAPAGPRALMGRLGSATLPYFFLGNALLLLTPHLEPRGAPAAAALAVAHLAASCAATLLWLRWAPPPPPPPLRGGPRPARAAPA